MAELSTADARGEKHKMYAIANRKIESSRDGIDDDDDDDNFGTKIASARRASASSAVGLKSSDDAFDAYDGMDHIEAFVGPLRFPKDRRIVELRNLLATARPAPIYLGNPNASNVDGDDDDQEGQNTSAVNEDDPNAASDPGGCDAATGKVVGACHSNVCSTGRERCGDAENFASKAYGTIESSEIVFLWNITGATKRSLKIRFDSESQSQGGFHRLARFSQRRRQWFSFESRQ